MAASRVRLGRQGERLARQYLEGAGYGIVAANYRCPWGEIDLIAQDGRELVFVEVRTRRSVNYGTPPESITAAKREHLRAAALDYLQKRHPEPGRSEIPWRIDLISIRFAAAGKGPSPSPQLEHLKYAVEG